MGFQELPPGSKPRVGWLVNMVPSLIEEPLTRRPVQAVDLFFLSEDPAVSDFRTTIVSRPYMYLATYPHLLREVDIALRRRFVDVVADISTVHLNDMSAPNHLAHLEGTPFLKLETRTLGDLFSVRKSLQPIIKRNMERNERSVPMPGLQHDNMNAPSNPLDAILDMREYDVAPVNRLAIDKKINVGYWYKVTPGGDVHSSHQSHQDYEEHLLRDQQEDPFATERDPDLSEGHANDFLSAHLTRLPEIVERASPVVLAFDIECTKKPLKFPDAEAGDQVMMISWMVDGNGFLAINREVVSKDIDDFEYRPHPEFHGSFEVYNEPNEKAVLQRFFTEVRLAAPRVFVTFNGDYFDWPFIETRASMLGMDMGKEISMRCQTDLRMVKQTEGRSTIHMDVFHWVNRDSYLPQGSRGLKAVTRVLLGFEPEEIPPEEMVKAAIDRPDEMAKYSVSDAVCTFHLYMKYVHPFIFSLCNIIPLSPDDVLRKGSGTLCEMLLMCQAREKRIVAPNKHIGSATGKLTEDGHVLESETYIGGHVEALRTGVYRSDLPLSFDIDLGALNDLEKTLDETLKFAITVESKTNIDDVTNYDEVRDEIVRQLHALREKPRRNEKPLIYHLDVSAMYPNIILTNRLQPHAVVTPAQCAACDFNGMSECQRDMEWTWRGEFYPASRGEAEMIQRRTAQEQRQAELRANEEAAKNQSKDEYDEQARSPRYKRDRPSPYRNKGGSGVASFNDEEARKDVLFRSRLKEYCRRNYKKTLDTRVKPKTATICQRENPFYVDTVRAFRDRRYEYKALLKKQKKLKVEAKESGDTESLKRAEKLVVLYDSLQLAHKCILNSFYGYVMRKGARWYSMEMAGIVTNTGGLIIRRAREFIDKVGLPLELDTDGIWCVLPKSFPETFSFKTKSGKKCSFNYICSVFNADVAANFSNHQYQDLVDAETLEYEQRTECSIMFEVDGPYRAMVLPASLEEGKSIKKRYAVFNEDGSLAELKGFEIKRRGELKLIKEFQKEIFGRFLEGGSILECYEEVGITCNKWLDILTSKGEGLSDAQLLELLVEQNNMSKPLHEYIQAGQKSCAITCASRMQEFLGSAIVKDKGLATTYVIGRKPEDTQVTSRAIPVKIFEFTKEVVRRRLLKKWTKSADNEGLALRELLDWEYYKGRLANAILKIVSIPAALQAVENPVPRIEYPAWLIKKCRELTDVRKQQKLSSFFQPLPKGHRAQISVKSLRDVAEDTGKLAIEDIEDLPVASWTSAKIARRRARATVTRRLRREQDISKRVKRTGVHPDERLLQANAGDPNIGAKEARNRMLDLLRASHPDIRYDYAGWLRYAKRIWRAQRVIRTERYAQKRRIHEVQGRDETSDAENEERGARSNATEPLGGRSFAERFGLNRPRKRSKVDNGISPDYAPQNFIVDLRRESPPQSFFKKKSVPLLGPGVIWQTISVSAVAGSPGEYQLWVLPTKKEAGRFESGQLYSIPLHVKRVLYFNSKSDSAPNIPGVSCGTVRGVTLPRSRPVHHLFRLEICEQRFQQTDKDITSLLNDPGAVDSVFGTQTPLEYEVIVTLGALCAPRKSVLANTTSKKLLRRGLCLDDIVPKSSEAVPYLQESQNQSTNKVLHQAFIYGSHALDGSSRALYALVAPDAKLAHVVVVTPAEAVGINLKRLWKNIVQTRRNANNATGDSTLDQDNPEEASGELRPPILSMDSSFSTTVVKTRQEAWGELQRLLSNLRDGLRLSDKLRSTGLKTILLAQWPAMDTAVATSAMFGSKEKKGSLYTNVSALEECVPAVRGYPVIRVPGNAEDGNYKPMVWENRAASTALSRFADVCDWLPNQLVLSRFAGIPIGNMSLADVHTQALDVLVGRELINRDHILWASNAPQPDLGGLEEDDNNLQNELPSVPEVVCSGSYRTVCVDTELTNLSIATILSSSYVNQVEGTDLAFDAAAEGSSNAVRVMATSSRSKQSFGNEEGVAGRRMAPLDEMASSAPAFRILKDLVKNWDKTASQETSPEAASIARNLLDHLNRWTRSESSILYDPALARFLGWLVKKMFRQLVGELKNLGASVVYASSSRLLLATPKTETIDGLRYAGFLEKTVKEKPLFRHLRFHPVIGVYASLLFVDRFNYGALPAPEESLILNGEFAEAQVSNASRRRVYASQDIPLVRMEWDFPRYLPLPIAVLWTQVVEEFIRRPMVQRLRTEEMEATDQLEYSEQTGVPETKLKKRRSRPRGDGFAEEVKSLVKSLTTQLLQKVHEMREKSPSLTFPRVPSALTTVTNGNRNPALEFVRSLCHVLSIDSASAEEVADMRRSLLQLLGVREFAKEAQFFDPALPVLLQDVICTYCNAVVNLDVARDSRLWSREHWEDSHNESTHHQKLPWACEYCGNSYDVRQIELDLTRIAQKIYTSYQVQDLICRKCHMVKRENMTSHCSCSGSPFELVMDRCWVKKHLLALQSVAEFHGFEFLTETVSWMCDSFE